MAVIQEGLSYLEGKTMTVLGLSQDEMSLQVRVEDRICFIRGIERESQRVLHIEQYMGYINLKVPNVRADYRDSCAVVDIDLAPYHNGWEHKWCLLIAFRLHGVTVLTDVDILMEIAS